MYPGAHLATRPHDPAVIVENEHGVDEVVTFTQLESRSIQVARALRSRGLRPGDHLAVLATNTARVFDIYWAAMRSGLYLTMVNWHLTPGEAAYIVDDCGARALIVDAALAEMAGDMVALTPHVETRWSCSGSIDDHEDLDIAAAAESTEAPADQPRGADMLYSSGTTGRPKGIKPELPDRQVGDPGDTMTTMNQTVWGVGPDTVYLSPAPLYHAAPLRTCAAVQALGGTVVVLDRFDAERALSAIERHRVTYSQWVPTMFVRMLRLPDEVRTRYDVSSLRVAVHAAAPCPVDIKRQMIDWWGPILSEYYSSTELNGLTIVDTGEWLQRPGTVGRAALGTVRICDESGAEVGAGTIGTIYFERDRLPFEYHKAPEKTRAAQHPEHLTWTTTGDVGYVDEDGYLFLTDRSSFLIISGGVNIYPQEIEDALLAHPDVLDAAVVGLPDPDLGERVTAVVQPVPARLGMSPDGSGGVDAASDQTSGDGTATWIDDALAAELLDHLRGRIAGFKLPRAIVFRDSLPRTPAGKLVKRTITEDVLEGARSRAR
ncbi:acyl-CoA synthetase [Gordonia soli]|uniref:Putative fatty-acid--CoA ligase n=1 Tax=Gordonia soli NBRC 108243 TaxID=1223545 RepID=M0QH07_9ACTN|nr:acyl-CoA synthetase [Gordonia soli]GAC67895.1 putative fatty-acid--CoA ligase [Gordonia soli NBRC 108243]